MNRSTVLNLIKTVGPIARAELARQTGLSPATVTGITAELIEADLVFEKQTGDSSGGRRPILLALNPSGGYVGGIKLTETQLVGALTDLEATVIAKVAGPLPGRQPQAVVHGLARLVHELLTTAGLPKKKLLGVGVGLAGIVDSQAGLLRQSPFFGWQDLPLRDLLQDEIRCPVYVDNDVNTLTMAEKWFGAGQGLEHFLTLTVGRGIGMGIVVNGQFYRGAGGGAGEFGHTLVVPNGRRCDCGKRGCLETYAAYPGLMQSAAEAFQRGELDTPVDSVERLAALAAAGNPGAVAILAQAGGLLGQSVANLVNLFNPQRLILGGEGVRLGAPFFDALCTAVQAYSLPALFDDVEIRIEPWGDDAWARGAASLVLRELFESPVHRQPQPAAS